MRTGHRFFRALSRERPALLDSPAGKTLDRPTTADERYGDRGTMGILRIVLCACWMLSAASVLDPVHAQRGTVLDHVPAEPHADGRYIIYLHGRIIEEKGTRPTDERFGVYEYQQILDTLAASGADVIAEHRPQGTDFQQFGRRVANQVRDLMAAGVTPEHIAVIGFSKGGAIAIIAAAQLADPRVPFILLGACGDWLSQRTDVDIAGRVLSVYERSDDLGTSCQPLFARPGVRGLRHEVMINTGEGHGAFYRPRSEWLDPVFQWLDRTTG